MKISRWNKKREKKKKNCLDSQLIRIEQQWFRKIKAKKKKENTNLLQSMFVHVHSHAEKPFTLSDVYVCRFVRDFLKFCLLVIVYPKYIIQRMSLVCYKWTNFDEISLFVFLSIHLFITLNSDYFSFLIFFLLSFSSVLLLVFALCKQHPFHFDSTSFHLLPFWLAVIYYSHFIGIAKRRKRKKKYGKTLENNFI